jgi:hypothetical protein
VAFGVSPDIVELRLLLVETRDALVGLEASNVADRTVLADVQRRCAAAEERVRVLEQRLATLEVKRGRFGRSLFSR